MTRPPPDELRARRSLIGALAAGALRLAVPAAAVGAAVAPQRAAAAEPQLTNFELARDEDGLNLSYAVELELGKGVEDALAKSVPLFFVAEAEVYRDRWYWLNRRVAHTVRTFRVVFQPLTSTYRVTTVGGLSQNYASRAEALLSISRAVRWKIADTGQIEDGARHYVDFQFRLDTSQLPRPMQIGLSGESDWQVSVKRFQRIN